MKKNEAKALTFIKAGANLNYPPAQHALGCFHELGRGGLPKNDSEALKYYQAAPQKGILFAKDHVENTLKRLALTGQIGHAPKPSQPQPIQNGTTINIPIVEFNSLMTRLQSLESQVKQLSQPIESKEPPRR